MGPGGLFGGPWGAELELGWDLIEQSCSETKQLGRNQQQNGIILILGACWGADRVDASC